MLQHKGLEKLCDRTLTFVSRTSSIFFLASTTLSLLPSTFTCGSMWKLKVLLSMFLINTHDHNYYVTRACHLSLTWLQSLVWMAISPECRFLSSPARAQTIGEQVLSLYATHTTHRFDTNNTRPRLHFKDCNYRHHKTSNGLDTAAGKELLWLIGSCTSIRFVLTLSKNSSPVSLLPIFGAERQTKRHILNRHICGSIGPLVICSQHSWWMWNWPCVEGQRLNVDRAEICQSGQKSHQEHKQFLKGHYSALTFTGCEAGGLWNALYLLRRQGIRWPKLRNEEENSAGGEREMLVGWGG